MRAPVTISPAIKEALDNYERVIGAHYVPAKAAVNQNDSVAAARAALLSVVAAEEGRKYEGKIYTKEDAEALCEVTRAAIVQHYEPLVKLVKEWQEAYKAEPITDDAGIRYGEARRALAQWEAL